MWSYGFKLAAAGIAILLGGVAVVLLFDSIWYQIGLGAAIAVVIGGLLAVAWVVDRRDREKRAAIDELPRV
jgi:Flp pilus assembly protein TadB